MENLWKYFAIFFAISAIVTSSTAQEPCHHTLEAVLSKKILSSPNFPNPYDSDTNCTWLISAEGDYQIELKFFIMDTEPEYDTLRIYDGANDKAPVLTILHGKVHIPSSIVSSTGKLFLHFESDDSVNQRGFRAQYRVALASKINVTSVIQACLADTTISCEIYNFDLVPREAEFRVLLPQQAYITRFFMVVDGVRFVGEVEKKERVKETYEELEVQGITMGYVSSTKDLAKSFFTGIMLQPGKTVTFEIGYQQLLQRRVGRYTSTIVLTREFLIHDLSIDIFICARSNLTFLQVPPMEDAGRLSYLGQVRFLGRKDFAPPGVNVTKDNNVAHISYSNDDRRTNPVPTKRSVFVTHYDVHRDESGTLTVVGGDYFATFFSPGSPNLVRRIVFVLDVSGSMAGNKIEQVKIAMKNILQRLSRRDTFNIVQFESVVRTWKDRGLVPATAEAKKSAEEYIDSFDPEGKTNIHDALLKGILLLNQGTRITPWNRRRDVNAYRDYMFFLGDGKPTVGVRNADAILRDIRKANQKGFGINAIGFGKNVDVDFLQRLTRDNHGKWKIIYDDEDSHVQIQNFIAELGVATMTDISFTYSSNQVNFTTRRDKLVLVNGGEVGVFGRLLPNITDEYINVTISGKTFKPVTNEFRLPIDRSKSECNSLDGIGINELTKRGYGIAKLQETLMKVRQTTNPNENKKLTDEATDLSIEFDLVTPLTFLVVKKPNQTRDEDPPKKPGKEKPDKGTGVPETEEVKPEDPKEKEVGRLVEPLPEKTKPWVFEGDPHFIVALGNNITVCFTWNGTDGEIYNLLNDPYNAITLNGLIKYGPRSSHKSDMSECKEVEMNSTDKTGEEHVCDKDVESFFVKLGFVFAKEKLKIEVTPKHVKIIDERNAKFITEEIVPASDDAASLIRGNVGISVHNITKVHSFVNITLNGTVTFVINLKRGRNLPPEKHRLSLIDHMDMDIVGHENFSPQTEGLFGIFPKNADRDFGGVKKSQYPIARLRRPGKENLLQYRKHRISVDKITIPDPYSKIPRECWFTYEENAVTGEADDAFQVESIFEIPESEEIKIRRMKS